MMTAKARGKNQAVFYEEDATERPAAEAPDATCARSGT